MPRKKATLREISSQVKNCDEIDITETRILTILLGEWTITTKINCDEIFIPNITTNSLCVIIESDSRFGVAYACDTNHINSIQSIIERLKNDSGRPLKAMLVGAGSTETEGIYNATVKELKKNNIQVNRSTSIRFGVWMILNLILIQYFLIGFDRPFEDSKFNFAFFLMFYYFLCKLASYALKREYDVQILNNTSEIKVLNSRKNKKVRLKFVSRDRLEKYSKKGRDINDLMFIDGVKDVYIRKANKADGKNVESDEEKRKKHEEERQKKMKRRKNVKKKNVEKKQK